MRSFSKVVFDEFIISGGPSYTSVEDAENYGGRQLAIMAVCSNFAAGTILTVAIEHSGDGVNFLSKRAAPEIDGVNLTGATAVVAGGEALGFDSGALPYPYRLLPAQPGLRFVRLRTTLLNSIGAQGSAKVKLTLSVRGSHRATEDDDYGAEPTSPAVEMARAPVGSLARHESMMREVHELASHGADLAPIQRAAFLVNGLSRESREHLEAVDRHLMSLPAAARSDIRAHTVAMVQRALAHSTAHGTMHHGKEDAACCGPSEAPAMGGGDCGCGGAK